MQNQEMQLEKHLIMVSYDSLSLEQYLSQFNKISLTFEMSKYNLVLNRCDGGYNS